MKQGQNDLNFQCRCPRFVCTMRTVPATELLYEGACPLFTHLQYVSYLVLTMNESLIPCAVQCAVGFAVLTSAGKLENTITPLMNVYLVFHRGRETGRFCSLERTSSS